MKNKIGIGSKIILSIEVAVMLVIIFAAITSYFLLGKAFEKETHASLQSISSLKENNIKWFLGEITSEIVYMNHRAGVRQGLLEFLGQAKMDSKKVVEVRLREVLTYKELFTEVMVLDKEGSIVISTDATNEGKIKANEEYFQKAKEDTYLQSYFYDLSTGQPIMVVGTPIKGEKGELLGVLAGKVNVKGISELLSNKAGLGNTGETFLVNSFNVAVTELLKEPGAALKKTIYLPQIANCLQGQSNSYKLTDYNNDLVFGYYSWFPEIKSCLITKIDYAEAISPVNQNMQVLFLVFLAGGVLMGLMGFFLAKQIVRPIKKLHESVIKIKEGDFDVQSDIVSSDEIGEMAQSFNEMSQKLKASYSDLEQKVEDRTKTLAEKLEELEKMNKLMVGRELIMFDLKKQLREKENDKA